MPLAVGASINIPQQVSIWVWDIWRFLFPLIHPRVLIGLFAIYLILSLKGVLGLFVLSRLGALLLLNQPHRCQIWWEINPTGGTNSINTLLVSLPFHKEKEEEIVAKICFT